MSNEITNAHGLAGMVILYHPTEEAYDNILSYLSELDCLYVIDNSVGKSEGVVNKIRELEKIRYIAHAKNDGIALSINEVLNLVKDKYLWLLTMDQDARFVKNGMKKYLSVIDDIENKTEVFAFCPLSCDEPKINEDKKLHTIETCVTAGMILNVQKSLYCGGFREDFFIDEVDNEFCYRCNKNGFKLLQYREKLMKHVVGEHKEVRFLGKIYYIAAERPERLYYMMRNGFYVMRDYPQKRFQYISIRIRMLLTIILFEDNKWKKLCYSFKGIVDFVRGKAGRVYL